MFQNGPKNNINLEFLSLCWIKHDFFKKFFNPPFTVASSLPASAFMQTYMVVVGVSNYETDRLDLSYAGNDAILFSQLLIENGVPEASIILLFDNYATKGNILAAMKQLFSKADTYDEVIFYFSGHCGNGLFLPTDYLNGVNYQERNDIKDPFKYFIAGTKLCIADAYHSGSIKVKQRA